MKVSIITINYNNLAGLQKTMQSVLQQVYPDYEYIVIDGGSTDGSKEFIDEHASKLAYWISEPDQGVYDAMNKGLKVAKGDYFLMLNSGDYLIEANILEHVFKTTNNEQIIYCDLVWQEDQKFTEQKFPPCLTYRWLRKNSLGHQATFIHKSVHEMAGRYNSQLTIVADWAIFVLAICRYNVTRKYIPISLSVCGRDGISCKPESLLVIEKERAAFLKNEFSAFESDYEKLDRLIRRYQIHYVIKLLRKLGVMKKPSVA